MSGEKQKVVLTSVIAAVFLTAVKMIVGILTGSLGILSEAAHSALDLGAALVTLFAVKISDKPADKEHNYGHGKIESFSALVETLLLLVTCGWIIYEAFGRLFFEKAVKIEFGGSIWGIGIMVLSIMINISRARALRKAAKKYGSQAMEADALHFDSDVWSSLVVIGGLICVSIADYYKISALKLGDPLAALGVSVLVIIVSVQLGRRTIDVLLDTAPKGMINEVTALASGVEGVLEIGDVRIRPSGPNYFIDLNVGISRNESHRVVHSIVHRLRERLKQQIPNSDIMVSTFPVDVRGETDREVYRTVKNIVDRFPNCSNIHNIHIYEVSGKKHIAIHIEVKERMSLKDSHELSHTISDLIRNKIEDVEDVSVNFEFVEQNHIRAEDITEDSRDMIDAIYGLVNGSYYNVSCHDIKVYRQGNGIAVFLHCELNKSLTTEKIELISDEISQKIRDNFSEIEDIHIHVEPFENEP